MENNENENNFQLVSNRKPNTVQGGEAKNSTGVHKSETGGDSNQVNTEDQGRSKKSKQNEGTDGGPNTNQGGK